MTPTMKASVTREGVRVGLVVAAATWAWLVAVDTFAGQPFRAFAALGGVVPVTAVHVLLAVLVLAMLGRKYSLAAQLHRAEQS